MRLKEAVLLSAPIGFAAFLTLTARAGVAVTDGPNEALYGFPLFWIKPGPTSLSVIVDAAAALVDIACYQLLAGVVALSAINRWPATATSRGARLGAWVVSIAVVISCALILSVDASRGGVTFDATFRWQNVQRYALYVGVPGRR